MSRPVFLFLLWLLPFSTALGQDAEEQLTEEEQRRQLQALIEEIDELQSSLNRYQGERANELRELQRLEEQINDLNRELRETDRNIDAAEQSIRQLSRELGQLDLDRLAQAEQVKAELRALQRNGTQEPLKLLLNQEDPAQFSRMLRYYDYLLDARTSKIEAFLDTMQQIEDRQTAIRAEQAQLAQLREEVLRSQQQLEQRIAQRESLLAELEMQIGDASEQLEQRLADRERLEQLIRRVEEQIANLVAPEDVQPFTALKGKMQWPADGRRGNAFGGVRTGSMRWDGIMIRASLGDSVEAIHYGRVVFADYLRGFGMLVILDHGDGFMSLYGHNESLYVETGDWVHRGQQLASVGNSGGMEQSGLYFEIRRDGKPVDPVVWCI